MIFRLFLLLTLVPIVELSVLLEVHRGIANNWGTGAGLAVTFGSVFLSGLIGAALIRHEGLAVFRALRDTTARGEFPAQSLIDAALVLIGGTLLVAPGFLTDAAAFTLLIPWSRQFWRRAAMAWLRTKIERGAASFAGTNPARRPSSAEVVIDITPEDGVGPR